LPNPGAGDALVSAAFNGYFSRLAASGDPNGGDALLWPAYDAALESHLAIAVPLATGAGYRAAECDFLESLP
jgi:para-nitrobenzyl esterase